MSIDDQWDQISTMVHQEIEDGEIYSLDEIFPSLIEFSMLDFANKALFSDPCSS